MDAECYLLEQMIRERHAEARESARRAALLRQANERPRVSSPIRSRVIELGRSLVNAARTRAFEVSRALASRHPAAKRSERGKRAARQHDAR